MLPTTQNAINLLDSTMFAVQQCTLKTGGGFDDANDSIQDDFEEIIQTLSKAQELLAKMLA
jgi:hypothetical protein